MSLDISPDGKTIAFDMLGDIYTLPIDGGKATRITSGLAFDTHPKFSQYIVFMVRTLVCNLHVHDCLIRHRL